ALDRPVVAVSTLAVLAAGAQAPPANVLASIDARMGEVYAGAFALRDGEPVPLGPETVGDAGGVHLPPADGDWQGIGTGFAAGDRALAVRLAPGLAHIDASALPRAGVLARLAARAAARGELLSPERVEPAYLRDQVALTLAEQQALRKERVR